MVSCFDRRVATLLKTWLSAVGIHYEDTPTGLVVTSKDGAKIPVSLGDEGPVPEGTIVVHGPDLTGRNLKKSLETFATLMTQLGFEARMPVSRGAIPTHKAHYGNEFELVAFRHSEFRRAPNPPAAKLREYESTVNQAVWKFHRMNSQTCQDHVMEVADLSQYALIWTTNYIAFYEDPAESESERRRFLSQYLSQRFYEFRKLLDKKGRNTLPTLDLAYIALHGIPFDYSNKESWYAESPTDPDAEDVPRRKRTNKERLDGRRSSAAFLDEHLAEMDHDHMVEVLSGAVQSDRIHDDARREASRRLRAHSVECHSCTGKELPRVQGDDPVPSNASIVDENGNVYANAREAAKALGVYASNVRAVLSGRYSHTGGHTFKFASANVDRQVPGTNAPSVMTSQSQSSV